MTKKKILIVDDEAPIRNASKAALLCDEYDIHTAESGENAIEMLKEGGYDLVITDQQMYEVDGVELLEHVNKNYPGTKMIMVTGYGSTDSALKVLKHGAYDYLTKPIEINALVSLVKKCLGEEETAGKEASQQEGSTEKKDKKNIIVDRLRKSFRYSDDKVEVDVEEVLWRVIRMFNEHFSSSRITMETNLASDLPKVLMDPLALEQVFMHLITNACDALEKSDRKSKTIGIKSSVNKSGDAVIFIEDNGCGIPESDRESLFKPGFTTKDAKKGSAGFGLSYSNKAIERIGGKIEYQTEEGSGSTFTVILPPAKA